MDQEYLANAIIRHEMAARGLDAKEADRIVRILNDAIEDTKAKLVGRYAVAQAKGFDWGKARTKYYEDITRGLPALIAGVYKRLGSDVEDAMVDRAQYEFEFMAKAAKAAGSTVKLGSTLPDTNFLRILARDTPIPVDEHTSYLLGPWIEGMETRNLQRLGGVIRNAMIRGDTPNDLAGDLEKHGFAKSRRSAQSLAITANASVANQARLETFKRMGMPFVEWSSILDRRTSPGCQDLSGRIFAIDQPHPTPPRHIRCRSILLPRKNDTDPPLHKPYREWLRAQDAKTQDQVLGKQRGEAYRKGTIKDEDLYNDEGSFRTLEQLRRADAKIVATPAVSAKPRFTSPVNPATTAQTIEVVARKDATKSINARLIDAMKDLRYDPIPEFKGIKAEGFGKATLSAEFSDEGASLVAALMPEVDAITDALGVPRLRGFRTISGSIGNMGDGSLGLNPTYFNAYASELGEGATAGIKAKYEALKSEMDALKVKLEKAQDEYRAKNDQSGFYAAYGADVKTYHSLSKRLFEAKRKLAKVTANTERPISTWKPSDDVAKRPYNAEAYFAGIDKARMVLFHETAHQVHQQLNRTARRSVATPPLEKRLKSMFFGKFHGRGPAGAKGLDAKNLQASTYATSNEAEWFAENFALFMLERKDLMDKDIEALIEELIDANNG